jgi:hypothetical protein
MNSKFFLFLTTIFFCSQLQPGGWMSKGENPNAIVLINAIDEETYNIFCTVLSEGGCNIDANIGPFWNSRTPMNAIIENHEMSSNCILDDCILDDCFHLKALHKLIEAGASINTLSFQLGTLIKNHKESNCTLNDCFHIEAFKTLVEAEANVNVFASYPGWGERFYDVTILHLAAYYSLPDFVKILVKNGAELRAQSYTKDEDGEPLFYESPLTFARYASNCSRKEETIKLLKEYEEKMPGEPIYHTKRYVSSYSGGYPSGMGSLSK